MNALILSSLVLASLVLVQAGKDECRISGRGKLVQFAGTKVMMKMPCKYQATTYKCQGYKIHVAPGQAFDSKARYFTDTVWISIMQLDTNYYWKGRTSTKRVMQYFNDTTGEKTPFRVKEEELDGAPFKMVFETDMQQNSVTLGVDKADWKVKFYGYDEGNKMRMKRVGVDISCPEADYGDSGQYPDSLCGNSTYSDSIRDRKRELKTGTKTKTILYDILNNGLPAQTNPQCDTAIRIFDSCGEKERVAMVKACYPLVGSNRIMKCLNKYYFDPMDVFIYCMKYMCEGNADSCDMLNEAMEGCPKNSNLPLGSCPKSGI